MLYQPKPVRNRHYWNYLKLTKKHSEQHILREVRRYKNRSLMFKNLGHFQKNYDTSTHPRKNTTHTISANPHLR